jgi:hypothetical protein
MVIDLSLDCNIPYDNYVNEYKMKTDTLLSYINKINDDMTIRYNHIIIPMTIYNIIECSDYFKSNKYDVLDNDLRKVGTIGEFECYLDIYLPPNEILISWDKSTSRDVKIESILSDKKSEKQKKIKVIP